MGVASWFLGVVYVAIDMSIKVVRLQAVSSGGLSASDGYSTVIATHSIE